jgi:type III secretory pathway component EscT
VPAVPAPSFVTEVLHAADAAGIDLTATGFAWARVSATVTLVPAFGLRALPAAARGALGVALALAIAPAVAVHHGQAVRSLGAFGALGAQVPWPLLLVLEVLRGLPTALAAAIPLWGATMVGGVVDSLRGDSSQLTSPVVDGQTTSLGVLFALLASALFLAGGGAARVVGALASLDLEGAPGLAGFAPLAMVGAIVHQLSAGLEMAVALAAPLLVAAVVVEVGGALIARAASPGQFQQLLAPVRALALLGVLALVVGRIGELLARWSLSGPF